MLSDGSRTFTWEHGRQLKTLAYGGTTWNFTYATNGLRTGRTGGSTTYGYVYNGSQMSQMTVGSNTLKFTYANGSPVSVTYNGTIYYYVTNLQGDVTAILNTSGTAVVNYTYDAWGNILSTTGSMATTLGVHNPLRYRGYVYDQEYGLYYLQSRYYNPAMGRFISADAYAATGQGLLGNNMFAYCINCPIMLVDPSGNLPKNMFALYEDIHDVGAQVKDQGLPEYADISVGYSSFDSAGCGPAAIYNTLLFLGDNSFSLEAIIAYLSKHNGLSFGGFCGTKLSAVVQFFWDHNYEVSLISSNQYSTAIPNADAFIIKYWWVDSGYPFIGSHYVAGQHFGNFGVYYNEYKGVSTPIVYSGGLDAFLNHEGYFGIQVIVINKRSS